MKRTDNLLKKLKEMKRNVEKCYEILFKLDKHSGRENDILMYEKDISSMLIKLKHIIKMEAMNGGLLVSFEEALKKETEIIASYVKKHQKELENILTYLRSLEFEDFKYTESETIIKEGDLVSILYPVEDIHGEVRASHNIGKIVKADEGELILKVLFGEYQKEHIISVTHRWIREHKAVFKIENVTNLLSAEINDNRNKHFD